MPHLTTLAALAVSGALLSTSAFAVDTQLLNLVMPDAQIMAGLNVTTAKISPFGQFLLSRMATTTDKGLQDFVAQTGFDPRQDVTEILAASNGAPASGTGLVLAKGSFNVDKLVAALPTGGKQQVQTYAGATLISSPDEKQQHAVAFLNGTVAVMGDIASVKAALDRASAVNSINPALATRVQQLSTTEDAWSVSLASLASLLPPGAAGSPVASTLGFIKSVQSSSGGVKFGNTIELTGQAIADTPQNAAALADVVRMISGLIMMTAAQDPKAAGAAELLKDLKVSATGTAVDVSASIPETQVEALIQLAASSKPAPAARKGTKL